MEEQRGFGRALMCKIWGRLDGFCQRIMLIKKKNLMRIQQKLSHYFTQSSNPSTFSEVMVTNCISSLTIRERTPALRNLRDDLGTKCSSDSNVFIDFNGGIPDEIHSQNAYYHCQGGLRAIITTVETSSIIPHLGIKLFCA